MKLNRFLVTNYLKKILITIISLSVFLFPALAFASDDFDQEQAPLEVEDAPFSWVDLEQAAIMKGAEEIKAVTATTYSVDDIYNLLYAALRGSSSATTYSLPYIANRVNSIYSRLGSMQTNDITTQGMIEDIRDDVHAALFGDSPYAMGILAQLADMLDLEAGNTTYTVTELTGMIWSIVQNIESDLATLQTLSNQATQQLFETQRTNSKLEYVFSAIEDTINIKWYSVAHTYNGTSLSLSNNFLTANASSRIMYSSYKFNSATTPQLYRITIPLRYFNPLSDYIALTHIYTTSSFETFNEIALPEYFVEYTTSGIYLYFFNFQPYTTQNYFFQIEGPRNVQFRTDYEDACDIVAIPFDTLDYQIIRTAFNEAKSATSLSELDTISSTLGSLLLSVNSGSDAANSLADYIVSPEKQAAEDASQQVINSTLDNFTGSGGGAAQKSDSDSMKDISVSVKSGINGGGSPSNATDVLNPSSVSGQTFWIWFSTTTKNNVENPYPAPVVNNTRKGSDGDEIIDTLSGYQEQLRNLLGGDSK